METPTIFKKRDFSKTAFIDTAKTNQGKFLLAVFINDYQAYKIFDNQLQMDNESFEFISVTLEAKLKDFTVVKYDGLSSNVKLLGFVRKNLKIASKMRTHWDSSASVVEPKMYQLIKNN